MTVTGCWFHARWTPRTPNAMCALPNLRSRWFSTVHASKWGLCRTRSVCVWSGCVWLGWGGGVIRVGVGMCVCGGVWGGGWSGEVCMVGGGGGGGGGGQGRCVWSGGADVNCPEQKGGRNSGDCWQWKLVYNRRALWSFSCSFCPVKKAWFLFTSPIKRAGLAGTEHRRGRGLALSLDSTVGRYLVIIVEVDRPGVKVGRLQWIRSASPERLDVHL